VTRRFKDTIQGFKTSDEEVARAIMADYKQELSIACDNITNAVVSGKVTDLSSSDAAALALYARYLKRIAAHRGKNRRRNGDLHP
jgi:phosphate uptake regulator